jgi:two-component system, NarL family, response regulator LiaR
VTLKILIADDHSLIRTGIRSALAGVDDIELVGEATTSESQLLALIERTSPDVLLLDIHNHAPDSLACLDRVLTAHPSVRVVVLAEAGSPGEILSVLELGATGYILKSIDPYDLAGAIRHAVNGTFFTLGGLPFRQAAPIAEIDLSPRELEVLQRMAAGLSNRQIAQELWLSDQTVKFHLHRIYRKLGVANRTEAARYAYERGLAESAA